MYIIIFMPSGLWTDWVTLWWRKELSFVVKGKAKKGNSKELGV